MEKSIQLKKSTYKLIIPIEVEEKIRHLCNKISSVEWSGTLFYNYSGSFEDNTLEIRCVDIFPMDIGSSSYTEFDMSPDVIAYMTEHPELLDCQIGLIHSHNSMSAFFSGTDISTLVKEGNDRNHFVSLIVNNEGTYTAAITRKISNKKIIKTTYTYKSFDDVKKTGTELSEEENTELVYNYLDIIKEGAEINNFSEIDERLKIIKSNKEKVKEEFKNDKKDLYKSSYFNDRYYKNDFNYGNYVEKTQWTQPSLFDESEPPRIIKQDEDTKNITVKASDVKIVATQLITGSIALSDTSKIDLDKWANQMVNLFNKRFDNDIKKFELWAETFTEFVVTNFIPEEYKNYEDEYVSELCANVFNTLDKLPQNKYIDLIKNALLSWII